MSTIAPEQDLAEVDVTNLDLWQDGPPHELFRRLREEDITTVNPIRSRLSA